MRNRLDTVMIFCAGRGTRMGALSKTRPKPLIEVMGRPLVAYALDQLEDIDRKFANTHYLSDQMENWLNSAGIESIFESALLETGGGFKNASPRFCRDAVYTMNSDAVWLGQLGPQVLEPLWDPQRMDALLLTIPLKRAHGHRGLGDFILDGEGRLTRGPAEVYTGLQIIKVDAVAEIKEKAFSLRVVWDRLLERGTLFGASYAGEWCDVGHPAAIELTEELLKR